MGGQPGARCNTKVCGLRPYSEKPLQVDLADGMVRDTWMGAAVAAVIQEHGAEGAWWSTLRRTIESKAGRPWSNAWWGGVAARLRDQAWTQVCRRTCTELSQRNMASEWYWSPLAKEYTNAATQ